MPEGMTTELVVFAILVTIIGSVFFLSRRQPPSQLPPEATQEPAAAAQPTAEEQPVAAAEPELAGPVEVAQAAAPAPARAAPEADIPTPTEVPAEAVRRLTWRQRLAGIFRRGRKRAPEPGSDQAVVASPVEAPGAETEEAAEAIVGGLPEEPLAPSAPVLEEVPEEIAPAAEVPEQPAPPLEELAEDLVEEAPPAPVEVPRRPHLRERLGRSRKFLAERLADAFGHAPDDETWDDVEAALIQADVGVEVAAEVTTDLKSKARERRISSVDEVRGLLAEELVALFDSDRERGLSFHPDGTTVWMIVGVNGTGKTTTIGKLANDLTGRGHTVALAAADTFRAAADEQLGVWAERAGAQLVKHQPGADPGAVAFDAYRFAAARELDVLLIDTAGRLHTRTPLMDELGKVRRVVEKEGHVDETLLVIDATGGQNGLVQAREFAEAVGVTGIVLTKLDGTAKGGIALAIERTLDIPIKLIGVGEGADDLEPFDPKTFVDALLS